MHKRFTLLALLICSTVLQAQDMAFARQMIDSLCAPYYGGRGYVDSGDIRASDFLARQLDRLGVPPGGESYFQPFQLQVNTFPGKMEVVLNKKSRLEPGTDFIVHPSSRAATGRWNAQYVNRRTLLSKKKMQAFAADQAKESFLVLDTKHAREKAYADLIKRVASNPLNARGYIILSERPLTWAVGREASSTTVLTIDRECLKGKIKRVEAAIDQQVIPSYETRNVIGKIPGRRSDSVMVFSAHYDHLGRMGEATYIPGANDNASGTALLLDLARHYRIHPPEFDTYIIFFAAEEAGLVGSMFFVEHPVFELERVKFVINVDVTGDAKDGVTAVNGKIFKKEYALLNAVRDSLELPLEIAARGEAANSDHYPFYKKGVPSFFIYGRGDYKHYHNVMDRPDLLPLNNYDALFTLLRAFASEL